VNRGNAHAQLSQVSFVDHAGKKTQISAGLLGYVLPGVRMQWTLKAPARDFSGGGTLNARVNGEAVTQPISLDTASH
jgi:fimbrial chaperone protein